MIACDDSHCTATFETEHGMRVHFGHRHKDGMDTERCTVCGEEYEVAPSDQGRRKTCSHGCNRERRSRKVTITCAECGAKKRRKRHRLNHAENQFCSPSCHDRWRSKNQNGADHHQYERVEVECSICEATELRQPHRVDRSKDHLCSNECKKEWLRRRFSGKNNPRYKERVVIGYGDGWNSQRERCLQRDNHCCQICEATKEELGQDPDVHHIIPFSEFEDHEKANEVKNLVALCRSCHQRWEGIPVLPVG